MALPDRNYPTELFNLTPGTATWPSYRVLIEIQRDWQPGATVQEGTTDSTDDQGEQTMSQIIQQWEESNPGLLIMGDEIEVRIRGFEERFGMSSDELLHRIEQGECPESTEIMEWRILLDLR
jgi:hypothetical protein